MNDEVLLSAFVRERSEAAFQALVERHAGLVYASALRQTRDAQLAEDVAQAVFTLLARKAVSLRSNTVLSGWLFQTTRFVAARALRTEHRRRNREQEALAMQQLHADSDSDLWARLAPIIDDALHQLGTTDRDALLLRFVEGRSLREVGTALGVTEEAAKKRVTRAIEKLRLILGRGGVAATAAALGASLSGHAAPVPPAATVAALGLRALAPVAGTTLASSLVHETLRAWTLAKAKLVAGWGAVAMVTGLVVVQAFRGDDLSPTPRAGGNVAVEPTIAAAAAGEPSFAPAELRRRLRLQVVSAETGTPIAQAPVVVRQWVDRRTESDAPAVTDAGGFREINLLPGAMRLDVGVVARGWAARYATFPFEGLSGIPADYTLRLMAVTNAVGGWVRDAAGSPVRGAEIWFTGHATSDYSQRERPRERFGFIEAVLADRTDASGHWSFQSIPLEHAGFSFEARHPNHPDTVLVTSADRRQDEEETDEPLRLLWAGQLVSTLPAARTLVGLVRDERANPIAGARVQRGEQTSEFNTDAQGRFAVPKLPEGLWPFTVSADGYAPVRTNALIGGPTTTAPMIITLRTGAVMRVRLIDENGFEVPDAEVGLEQWGPHRSALEWRGRTDFSGRLEWLSAPPDMELELFAHKDGYCYSRDLKLRADGVERTFKIHHVLELHGHVKDAETGEPVRDFKAVPGYGSAERFHDASERWYAGETVRGANGIFRLVFKEQVHPWQVRINAEGYHEWISPPLTNRVHGTIEVALRPAREDDAVRGIVLAPDRKPVSGADVALLTFEHNVRLRSRRLVGTKPWVTQTDAAGRFTFPPNALAHSVAAVGASGYAHRRLAGSADSVTLELEPWGRVVGRVDDRAGALGVESIEFYDPTADNYQGRVSLLGSYSVKPGADRSFAFADVPPGQFKVFVNSRNGVPYHHGTPVTVRPGETVEVTMTEKPGARLIGRFVAPPGHAVDSSEERHCQLYADLPSAGSIINAGPRSELRQRELDFWTSEAGREQVNTPRVYAAMINDDGSFASTEPLPPGSYKLIAVLRGVGSVTRQLTVTEGQTELNLGEIPLRAEGK